MSFTLTRGHLPLLISFPHSGTGLPGGFAQKLTDVARGLPDTDWHVPLLYDELRRRGAWTIEAHLSRYVIDLNRDPDGASLYPGQSTTALCPVDTFDNEPVYLGDAPDADAVAGRVEHWYRPYHAALADTLDTMRERYGAVLLWDAHSIRSQVPRFFDGTLPTLNLGTARGASCAPDVRRAIGDTLAASRYETIVDGRFVGGHITRHYGQPDQSIHAVQMEIAQSSYMDETGTLEMKPIEARALGAALSRAALAALQVIDS